MGKLSFVPRLTKQALTIGKRAKSTLWAYRLSPNRTLKGLAREALGIEDPHLEIGKIRVAAEYIDNTTHHYRPEIILTLGSGLGGLADQIEGKMVIPYHEIPCFPRPLGHIEGHAGQLVVGRLAEKGGNCHAGKISFIPRGDSA